jgi:uncharacterized membrane protein YebE (DUF533 family)
MHRLIPLVITAFLATTVLPVLAANVPQRQRKQEHRIERGIHNGKLTPKETQRLRNQQSVINLERAEAKSDGKITHRERADMQHDLNRLNKDIHHKKYNKKRVHYQNGHHHHHHNHS